MSRTTVSSGQRGLGVALALAVAACASSAVPGPASPHEPATTPARAASDARQPAPSAAASAPAPVASAASPPAPVQVVGGELLFEGGGALLALRPHVRHVYFVTAGAGGAARPSAVLRRVPPLRGPAEVVAEGLGGAEIALTRDAAWYPRATAPAGLLALPLGGGDPRLAASGELRLLTADRDTVYAVRPTAPAPPPSAESPASGDGGGHEIVRLAALPLASGGATPSTNAPVAAPTRIALATGPVVALAVRDGRATVCASPAAGAPPELQTASPTGGGFTRRGVACRGVHPTADGGLVLDTPEGWVHTDAEARARTVVAPAGVVAGVFGYGVYWVTAGALWRIDVRSPARPPLRLTDVTADSGAPVSVEHLAIGSAGVYVAVGDRLLRLRGAPDPADVDAEWRRAHVPRRARP